MPSHIAASMFGGAGGRGSRASVGSLGGLRNALRNEPDRGSASTAHTAHTALATPTAPEDDRQTLRLLNDRLSGYLGKVKQLQEENDNLEKQIDEILTKRKTPEGRDWDAMEKPLDDLKKQVKGITMDNAKLLLQIDNTTLANDDLKKKLGDEKKAGKELEKDLEALKKSIGDTKLNQEQTKKQIGLVKEELDRLQQEHKDEVDVLYEKIQDSEVKVEIDSQDSNLTEILNKIRSQYSNLGKTNLKETEEKYQSKFDNIKVAEARNAEVLQTGTTELKDLFKQRQTLDVKIHSVHSMTKVGRDFRIGSEEALRGTRVEYGQQLAPLNQVVLELEAELRKVRSQVEHQVETNRDLLCVKMKLEEEVSNYQHLIHGITTGADSLEFSLEDAELRV
uniref:keratin, type I cytoskeletal 18-like n=1 Tax=Monopterus albus TaxID=43700 RepID=UPI0009B3DB83|nr:keratin, type I cytoskeletal 18-like [Monopterus albus]